MAKVYEYDKNNEFTGFTKEVTPENYTLAENESYDQPTLAYEYDNNFKLVGLARINLKAQVPNTTTVTPPDGLFEPTFDPVKRSWFSGVSEDQYRKMHNVRPNEPTDTAKMVNGLAQQVVALQARVAQLEGGKGNG